MENNKTSQLSTSELLKLETQIMERESDKEFLYRYLKRDDYDKGFMDILSQLTVVGNVTKEDYEKRFDEMFPKRSDVYKIVVLVDRERD